MYKVFLFFCFSITSFSQTIIEGKITTDLKKPIPYINIVIMKKGSDIIKSYTFSKTDGTYRLEIKEKDDFLITFSGLGYANQVFNISTKTTNFHTINVEMQKKATNIDEVIVTSKKKAINIKNDTIVFVVSRFSNGNEQTVEDLLKKIPGLSINSKGTIKIGNKEIEKLMIDGDDFFGKGYKILSKNMPAYPIEEIEVLKNYSNNRLLKGIEESDKVALNLKLNEKSKRIWFGNIKSSSNFKNKYELLSNLMNFGKKNKFYFLTNLNNIGNNVTGNINDLIRPFSTNQPGSIGDKQRARNLIDLSSTVLKFKKHRTNFNNAEFLSLNAIFNPTENLKIKTLGFFNWDEQDFFRNSVHNVTSNGISFTNTEDYKLRNKKTIGFAKIDLTYNISKTKMIKSITKYNSGNTNKKSNLVFNGIATIEKLHSNNTLFDQKITYSNKLKEKKVFLFTGRFIAEKIPQNYSVNQFFYQDLFPSFTSANNVLQESKNQMQFIGFEAHLLDRKKNNGLLELQFGNEFRKDKLNTTYTLFENTTILEIPSNFQNNTIYQHNDLYFKTKYRHKIKNFAITGKLDFHQLFNKLKFNVSLKNQRLFFVNPSIDLDWKINDKNKIKSSYSYNTTNAKILDVYNNYLLTGFRSFTKGTGTFNQLNASTLFCSYQLGNWSDQFFANTFIFYSKNFDFFSSNTLINQNFTQSEKIIIKDREFLSVTSKINYYFNKIASNLKINLGYSKSNYKNIINNSDLREVKSNNYNYGLELRSGFKGVFNYHIGTKWNTTKIETATINNSFTNNISFFDLSFVFNDKFDVQFQTERYFFGNLNNKNNTYYFLDFDTRYIIKKNKLTLAILGKNLFNTETYKTFSINDISTSTTEYRLLPRHLLLKVEYRF